MWNYEHIFSYQQAQYTWHSWQVIQRKLHKHVNSWAETYTCVSTTAHLYIHINLFLYINCPFLCYAYQAEHIHSSDTITA